MQKKQVALSVAALYDALSKAFPNAECELEFGTPFELFVATVLSAQCTDKRVNEVTYRLFKKWSTPEQFAALKQDELERDIYSCGFYRNKARNIIAASREILESYNGVLPDSLEELEKLPGAGRKTASVVYAVGFGGAAMPVDTHVFRVSKRLGLSDGLTPLAVERDLRKIIPEKNLTKMHHYLIFLGRYVCKAKKQECDTCPVVNMCPHMVS